MRAESGQSCVTLCDPKGHRLPGSSVHGILQARILQWVAISSSGVSFWPSYQNHVPYVSCIAGRFFTTADTWKPTIFIYMIKLMLQTTKSCNARDLGSIPGLGRPLGEGNGYLLQYSSLNNSVDCNVKSLGSQRVGHNWMTFTFTSVPYPTQCLAFKKKITNKLLSWTSD